MIWILMELRYFLSQRKRFTNNMDFSSTIRGPLLAHNNNKLFLAFWLTDDMSVCEKMLHCGLWCWDVVSNHNLLVCSSDAMQSYPVWAHDVMHSDVYWATHPHVQKLCWGQHIIRLLSFQFLCPLIVKI